MKPSPYQIAAFAHVARVRSFSEAARQLGVTQSSVTQHVAKLEKLMESQLFVRRRDRLELTPIGRELFDVADRWTTLEQVIQEKVESYQKLTAGHLKITATAPRPAMPIIAAFAELYPQVIVNFTLTNWTVNTHAVRSRDVDIAIFTDPEHDENLLVEPLQKTRYLAYMHRDHKLASRESVSLHELCEETVIIPEDGSLTKRVVDGKLAGIGRSFSKTVRMTTFAVAKEAVLHGVGIGVLLENSLYPASRLVGIPIDEMTETYEDCLVLPAEKQNLKLVSRFVEIALNMRTDLTRGLP
ncbi:LysR family transcriptional regulator [Hoeflea poritis]|uniref:LysR family transcriptional regulator n=1 Tax=Hoeflea poritis TaxID=2993659 RepID=A0ABT4VSA8_9HYPH|nr:LysR family transcriptional regulator [Hoeflea poritis]MDA4847602.1 LysR family transcriptional regulator [Hoeflea poritis]